MIKYDEEVNPHFSPTSVRGVVSRVQTALPSIRIRLRNLHPDFHPIYQKGEMCSECNPSSDNTRRGMIETRSDALQGK